MAWLTNFFSKNSANSSDLERGDDLEGFRDDAVALSLSDREAEEYLLENADALESALESAGPSGEELAQRVGPQAYNLIVRHETGGPEYYKKVYKEGAIWPEAGSGLTIGFGYDLGYQKNVAAFVADWKDQLSQKELDLLSPAVGVRGPSSKPHVAACRAANLRIPWDKAEAVYKRVTLPKFARFTWDAVPNCDTLSGECFGVLVSLAFNRGPSFSKAGPRYEEMRAIRTAMAEKRPEKIPALIRTMRRIWRGTKIQAEMDRRRGNEARVFEDALIAERTIAMAGAAASEATLESASAAPDIISSKLSDEEVSDTGELEGADERDFSDDVLESASQVTWAKDADSPDYAHLNSSLPVGLQFTLRAEDLQFLADLNDFTVDANPGVPVLFGLRGCAIVNADAVLQTEVKLKDVRPTHATTLCAIGAWDRMSGKIAVFPGSTVPHEKSVRIWKTKKTIGNILATGCYGYIVGNHNGRPGCFLLRKTVDDKRVVVVRRSSNDLTYDRRDVVDITAAGDNIHPAFTTGTAGFSSFGCQVIIGQANTGGNHSGPWAEFRKAAGLKTAIGNPNTPYTYMLLTGREAMLAARARTEGATAVPEIRETLRRLRYGSKGPAVARLQTFLGIAPSGDFDGPTSVALHKRQQGLWDKASDGVFTPALDKQLAANVFAAPDPNVPSV